MYKVAPSYEHMTMVEVYENEKKALMSCTCPKCGGSGMYIIPPYFSGVCFTCDGRGKVYKKVKVYTDEEYDRYIKSQERAKEKKKAQEAERRNALLEKSDENKKDLLVKWGYDPKNPVIYVVTGNTFEVKEEIKERGGRFNPVLGWFYTKETPAPAGHDIATIAFDDIYEWLPFVKSFDMKNDAKEVVEKAKLAAMPESTSDFVGEVKERVRDLKVTLTNARPIESRYGTSILFTFKQEENVLVWMTSCPPDSDKAVVGNEYLLTATVKSHDVYNGVKQTRLTRCLLKETF